MNPRKLLAKLAKSQTSIRCADLERPALALGFVHDRSAGSHRIYIHRTHRGAQLNLQPDKHGQAKTYQVRQLVKLIEEYSLRLEEP